MYRKLLSLILVIVTVFAITACNKKQDNTDDANSNTNTSNPTISVGDNDSTSGKDTALPTSYSSAYDYYTAILNKMQNTVEGIVDKNNELLESSNPDGYISDPSYMILSYAPFTSLDMSLSCTFNDQTTQSVVSMTYSIFGFENVVFTVVAPGEYKITSESTEDDGSVEKFEELLNFNNGSMRYEQIIDGVTDEFYEFISLGDDKFALQSNHSRAIITYKNGEIIDLIHSNTIYERDWETNELSTESVVYDSKADSAWGKTGLDEAWVTEKGTDSLMRLYKLDDNTLNITGKKKETNYETSEVTYIDITPVIIDLSKIK